MKKKSKPKLITQSKGKLKYNMGTWVDRLLKNKFEYWARRNGHTSASFQRFLMQREVDDLEQAKDAYDDLQGK